MIKQAISKLTDKKNLTFDEAKSVFEEIFDSNPASSQIAAFLISLKMKKETQDEILAAAIVIRERAAKLSLRQGFLGLENKDEPIMDTCGTGGSGLNKFNISTATAFVVAAGGVKVAKHGNRAMSSNCGSADVLEALGVNVNAAIPKMQQAIEQIGIGFLYAPLYHSALAKVAKIRKEMGVRTIFNILGPLCNPALANYQLLGVYSKELILPLAKVLKRLGVVRAFIVNGKEVQDEISLAGPTQVAFLNNKKITSLTLNPTSFGLKRVETKDLLVKDATVSAKVIKDIFKGKRGAPRDMVLVNASACFYILGKVKSLKEGAKLAAKLIDDRIVQEKFLKFKNYLAKK